MSPVIVIRECQTPLCVDKMFPEHLWQKTQVLYISSLHVDMTWEISIINIIYFPIINCIVSYVDRLPVKSMDFFEILFICTELQYAHEVCSRPQRLNSSNWQKVAKVTRKHGLYPLINYDYCPQHFIWCIRNGMQLRHVKRTSVVLLRFIYATEHGLDIDSSAPFTLLLIVAIQI